MSVASGTERLMLRFVNEERSSRGLDPLRLELNLNEAAEDHSEWMLDRDIFSHTGRGGSSAGDRMEDAGFDFARGWGWGENVAYQSLRGAPGFADDVEDLHDALMNSPGHRANILNPDFEVIGIGIERGDFDGFDALMVTQNFAYTGGSVDIDRGGTPPPPPRDPEPESPTPSGAVEIGTSTVTQRGAGQWHSVQFSGRIDDAVVVMGPVSDRGGAPLTVRVDNVTETGFDFQIDEWDYLDGAHATETLSWMAITEGTHELADGRLIQAGSAGGNHNFSTVSLNRQFDDAPIVLTQLASDNGVQAATTRVGDVSADSFRFRLQEEEANGKHAREQVDWIAVEGGIGNGIAAGLVDGIDHSGGTLSYGGAMSGTPALLAGMQTFNGKDTATVRLDANSRTRADVWIQEETSRDAETAHAAEEIGYLAMTEGYDLLFA